MKTLHLPLLSAALLLASCGSGSSPADTTRPAVSLTATQSGTDVTLSATASDNVGVTRVEFYRGTTLLGTDTAAPYTASLAVTAADNGPVTFTVRAYDAAGNVAESNQTVTVSIAPSTPAPTPNPTPTPTPTPSPILYAGVWGWSIANPTTGEILDQGAVTYNRTFTNQGRLLTMGDYRNTPNTRNGLSLLGPFTRAGTLETVFSVGTALRAYFFAQDTDNAMGSFEGKAIFEGSGSLADANNQPTTPLKVVMIQISTVAPKSLNAQAQLEAQAKSLAAQVILQKTF